MAGKDTLASKQFNDVQETQKQAGDKNNAGKDLNGKIQISKTPTSTNIDYIQSTLKLPKLSELEAKRMKELIQTLIIERSVCEARMYLARECKAEVAERGVTGTYGGPDISFNPSPFHLSTDIFPYELLPKTDMKPRELANMIVDFVNSLPKKSLVPLSVIEQPPTPGYSYTQSKNKPPKP